MPRIRAIATHRPTAADTKFCTVKPSIWVRWLIETSPENHCQLVFVTKLMAALNAPVGVSPSRSVGFSGRMPCVRSSTYNTRSDTSVNAINEAA